MFSRFLDPSRKLISVDYMLNVLNAASVGAIGMFLKWMERIDTLLFKKPSKIKGMIRKNYLDEYCIEKGLENDDMRRQLKWSLNKTLKYQWVRSEKSTDDGGISDWSLSDSDKENDPKSGIKGNKKSKHKLWEKSILITIDWVYGLDKYYSETSHKNAPILPKEKFEMHLAKARFIINFPDQWLGYITKGCGTVPYEKYSDFDGFNLHSIEKGPKFDEISRFIKNIPLQLLMLQVGTLARYSTPIVTYHTPTRTWSQRIQSQRRRGGRNQMLLNLQRNIKNSNLKYN